MFLVQKGHVGILWQISGLPRGFLKSFDYYVGNSKSHGYHVEF